MNTSASFTCPSYIPCIADTFAGILQFGLNSLSIFSKKSVSSLKVNVSKHVCHRWMMNGCFSQGITSFLYRSILLSWKSFWSKIFFWSNFSWMNVDSIFCKFFCPYSFYLLTTMLHCFCSCCRSSFYIQHIHLIIETLCIMRVYFSMWFCTFLTYTRRWWHHHHFSWFSFYFVHYEK